MDMNLTNLTAWSYGLASVGYAVFSVQLALGWRAGVHGLALLMAVGVSAVWGLLGVAIAVSQQPMLLTAGILADVLRVGGWYGFLLLIIRPRKAGEPFRTVSLASAALCLIVVGLVAQGMMALRYDAIGDPGRLSLLNSLLMAVFGVVLVEQLIRSVPADSRWSINPLCLGLAGAFIFDIYLYADALLYNGIDPDVFSVRGFVHALVIPLVEMTAARNRDWTFTVALSRRVVFYSAGLVVSGVYLLFVAAAGYYVRFFGGEWGRAIQVAVLSGGVMFLGLLVLSRSMRAKLKVLLNKHFFRYRYDYREEWLRFTKTLSACDGQSAMGQQVIRGLADMVESPSGGLWLRDASGRHYAQSARWNVPVSGAIEQADGALTRFLADSGWVINLEEYRSFPGRYAELRLPSWLSEVPNAWLIVPLASGEGLIGFVILATARTRLDINWEVNDLLKTAGRQAASFLGHIQASEALLEARKFDAFNRMSAFVVHDLKSVVAQLSLMLKNAERHRDNPEFQQDMLIAVEHAVDCMKQLLLQLREGTTPDTVPHGIDLAELIRRIQRAKAGQGPVPELQLEERVVANGHEDRVERVIGHIVQNAIDATDKSGRVWIKLERQGEQAMVEVGDTGHGMTPEFVRERLFKPFQTTKSAGMGIGAYESYQYVQELGGRVLVDSTLNVGTRVRLLLPLYEGDKATADAPLRMEVA